MANENVTMETTVDTASTETKNSSNNKWVKDKKSKGNINGLNLKAMVNGIAKGYEIDGSISVPSQSNIIMSRAIYKKDKASAGVKSNPGFALVDYLPILGSDRRQTTWAALTKQGANLWRTIRSATPHAENYQPGDVMANVFITGSLRYGLAEARRKLESLTWQSLSNQFVTEGIWRCLWNTDNTSKLTDFQGKMVGWRNKYNGIVNRLSAVSFPDIFPIFHRWEYLSSTIFRDCESEDQAQFYAFHATHLYDWQVREDPDDPGMDLVPISMPYDMDELLNELERISIKVTSDSDMNDMFSDIVLAFPTAQCLKWSLLAPMEIGKKLQTVHSMDVKWALHNAQIVNINAPTWHVTPEEGSVHGIMYLPNGKKQIGFCRPIMATNNDKMSVDRFMNLSQWVIYDPEMTYETTSAGIELINAPTEVLTNVRYSWFTWDFTTGDRTVKTFDLGSLVNLQAGLGVSTWDNASLNTSWYMLAYISAYLTFAFMPIFRMYYTQVANGGNMNNTTPNTMIETTYLGGLVEIERPFVVNSDQLVQSHNAARVGLWNIPVVLLNGKRNGNK